MEEENKINKETIIENNNFHIIKDVLKTKIFKISIIIFFIISLFLLAFDLGISVGFRKASFSYKWRNNYNNNIFPRKECMEPPFNDRFEEPMERGFINSSGATGEIIKINKDFSLIIKDFDNTEKIIILNENTAIREFKEQFTKEDLKVGQKVVIIGDPKDSGEIEAKLIRIMPEPINQNIDNINNIK